MVVGWRSHWPSGARYLRGFLALVLRGGYLDVHAGEGSVGVADF
jgi:hypothetical protein